MEATCCRCGRPGFATIALSATIGATRLQVGGGAMQSMCTSCVIELDQFFNKGHQVSHNGRGAFPGDSTVQRGTLLETGPKWYDKEKVGSSF